MERYAFWIQNSFHKEPGARCSNLIFNTLHTTDVHIYMCVRVCVCVCGSLVGGGGGSRTPGFRCQQQTANNFNQVHSISIVD